MFYLKIIFLTLFSTILYANTLNIDNKTPFYDLLPHSQIYIDKTQNLTIENIQKKDIIFKNNDKKLLGFGYSPDFNVWIKFTLKNNTNKTINKILEYDNSLTTEICFYNSSTKKNFIDGLFNINPNRKTINPFFKIQLKPQEITTYYIKASSHITTLIVKLNIYNSNNFYEKEIKHQLILALFFGAMFILAIYNLFIFFFTKDTSYLYYVLYIFGIIIHHTLYVGIAFIYLLKEDFVIYIVESASIVVAIPILALALFTKSFLQIKHYSINNKILNIFIFLIPISIIVFSTNDIFIIYRNFLSVTLSIYLIFLTIYSAFKKNRQAYFILFGWFVIFIAILCMNLSSIGIFNIYKYFPYLIETAFVLEAIVFSIALADRIKQLEKEKIIANNKLITQQQNEKERLEIEVYEKTNNLKIALDEKSLLLKELNHRVKNNMQTIVSLIRLQADEIENEKLKDIFITIQNRINAMSHIHELLYKQDDISHINAYEYFNILIEELKESYNKNINIIFDIKTKLKLEQAIYCGLILNELISNSFKHAFPKKHGNIKIKLLKKHNIFQLYISDDGIGYNQNISSASLGLVLVNTLVKDQLRGDINTTSTNSVNIKIKWSDNG